jgi:sugar phosphate permease
VVFLLLFYVVRGIATPVFKNYINLYTPSEMRATILSVRNLIIRIIFAVIGPLLGWLTDHLSLNSAFILAGAIYLTAALTIVWPWIKQREEHL